MPLHMHNKGDFDKGQFEAARFYTGVVLEERWLSNCKQDLSVERSCRSTIENRVTFGGSAPFTISRAADPCRCANLLTSLLECCLARE
mmetsp:Transcript_160/g.535  ORF Transcript_160/g.535 Transcript_160/m.535 type:complete len:88 (-) Transcript_160:211-474(-)